MGDSTVGTYGSWPLTGGVTVDHGYVRFIAQKFVDTLHVKAMQTESDLERLVTREDIDGNPMLIDSLKPLAADPGGELDSGRVRFEALTAKTIPTEQRQLLPTFHDYMFYVDPRDQAALSRKLDPTGQFMTAVTGAFAQKKDDVIIAALDANVTVHTALNDQQGGAAVAFAADDGTTLVAADSGLMFRDVANSLAPYPHEGYSATTGAANDIISGLGLNIKKLINARKALAVNYGMNSGARQILLVHPNQLHQLLANSEHVISGDYNAVKPLVTGEINQFLGMDVVVSNNVTAIANISDADLGGTAADEELGAGHYAYVFMPDALYYGASSMETKTDILPEKGHTLQVASYMHTGAVRLDGKKVVRIECATSDTFTLA